MGYFKCWSTLDSRRSIAKIFNMTSKLTFLCGIVNLGLGAVDAFAHPEEKSEGNTSNCTRSVEDRIVAYASLSNGILYFIFGLIQHKCAQKLRADISIQEVSVADSGSGRYQIYDDEENARELRNAASLGNEGKSALNPS